MRSFLIRTGIRETPGGKLHPAAASSNERNPQRFGGAARRGATFVVNVNGPSDVPALAEPLFLTFNAEVEFRIAMTPEDRARASLDALGKKWA